MNHPAAAGCLAMLLVSCSALPESPYEVAWIVQIGSSEDDESHSVAVCPSGNVYVSGSTRGDLGGADGGGWDAFLSKFDADGNELWTTQTGRSGSDHSHSVAVDASGNVYISGYTAAYLPPNVRESHAFLGKFDSAGNEVWTKQTGTSDIDGSRAVAVDTSGNIYISGWIRRDLGELNAGDTDAFLTKFDGNGNEVWTTRIGTNCGDAGVGVATDKAGNVYVTGSTEGDLGGTNAGKSDAFLSKLDPSGDEVWTRQIGTSTHEQSKSVAVDASDNVYISGWTYGDLGGPGEGPCDVFLAKFGSDGNELWTTQIGTVRNDRSASVAVDAAGNVYISGWTEGDFRGPNAGHDGGGCDAFLSKFGPDGNEVWTTQVGTHPGEASNAVAVDTAGNVYISGWTYGHFGGPNAGHADAFLAKFVPSSAE